MRSRLIFGFVGPKCSHDARKRWNAYFREQRIDAFFDFYKANSVSDLELRLSEMFLLERRGYLIDPTLQNVCVSLMDELDASAKKEGRVDTVVNRGGVLVGYYSGTKDVAELMSIFRGIRQPNSCKS
jgi:shikimate 5-dehydrogenase